MKYLIFLDFDGVLTSERMEFGHGGDSDYQMMTRFDPNAIAFLNRIHEKYEDVHFVWSTTWRNGMENDNLMNQHWAYTMFNNAGFRGNFGKPWKVNPDDLIKHSDRAEEIKDYLEAYAPHHKDYMIIDDTDYGFNDILAKKRFVKTDPDNGMLLRHMKNAWALTGTWDRKDGY